MGLAAPSAFACLPKLLAWFSLCLLLISICWAGTRPQKIEQRSLLRSETARALLCVAAGGAGAESPLGEASPAPCVLVVSPTGLQNDHKAVMKEVEEALHKLHAREKEKHAKDEAEALAEAMSQNQSLPQAFAKVNTVSPGSPASVSVRQARLVGKALAGARQLMAPSASC